MEAEAARLDDAAKEVVLKKIEALKKAIALRDSLTSSERIAFSR